MKNLTDLPQDLRQQVYELAKGGRIYMATHTIRKATKLDSKPAKALVMEILQAGEPVRHSTPPSSPTPQPWANTAAPSAQTTVDYDPPFSEIDAKMQGQILGWIDSGNKITAIKALRSATGLDLTKAVQIINKIAASRN